MTAKRTWRDTQTDRRSILQGMGIGAGALMLAACTRQPAQSGATSGLGPGGIELARPDSPVSLPLYDDNPAISSGLNPESGPLKVYCWQGTIPDETFSSFEEKYGVKVQPTYYATPDEALPKVIAGSTDFDVYECAIDHLAIAVANQVIQPINTSYIPNYASNVWEPLQKPWYDAEIGYTIPGSYWTSGISWNRDHLPDFDPASMQNPYDAFWQLDGIEGKVQFFDYMRDAISMTLLRNGVSNINTTDQNHLNDATDAIRELIDRTQLRFSADAYQPFAQGRVWIQQCWGPDLYYAGFYLPEGASHDSLAFWAPDDGAVVTNDTWVVSKKAQNPVLAHLWMNHVLDRKHAVDMVQGHGLITPIKGMEPDTIVADGIMEERFRHSLTSPEQVSKGTSFGPLSKEGETAWQNAWVSVKSNA